MTWENIVNRTIGYLESDNQAEFLKGAHIMHTKLSVQHQEEINNWQELCKMYKKSADMALNDLRTLAEILERAKE